jgi:ornithine cyclodeaminase/alanine dehydrogenase-like protein (mu-crystallin family)
VTQHADAREYRPLAVAPVELLFLSQEDVVAAGGLDMDDCLATIEETLVLHHRGETIAPQKSALHWSNELDTDERLGRIMAMPAYVGGSIRMAGIKWIPSVPGNPARGLPRGVGMILLSDPETGLPLCFMDGTVVSAMRTGAVSGLAARRLARPGARVVTLYGAGVQARTQLLALERTLPRLAEIRLHDPDAGQMRAFAEREQEGRPAIRPFDDAREAARGADLLVAATMAPEPFIEEDWFEPAMLLISVSSHDPTLGAIEAADLLVTDDFAHETFHPSRPFARAQAAGVVSEQDVVPLGAIIAGDHPGRTNPQQRILVSPVGLGIEDVAWATCIYRRAANAGLGASQRLWKEPIWT